MSARRPSTSTTLSGEYAAGTILTPDDKPYAGAKLYLLQYMVPVDPVQSGIGAADGTFHFDVPSGKGEDYFVLIDAPPWAYASARATSEADQVVALRPATTADVTLELPNGQPAANVEVALTQMSGAGIGMQGVWWVPFPQSGEQRIVRRTDENGKCRFERMANNGHLTFNVNDDRFAKLSYQDGVQIGRGPVTQGKPIRLAPACSIDGRVIGLDGKGAANVVVSARDQSGGDGGADGITDGEGKYHLLRLRAGTYAVIAQASKEGDLDDKVIDWAAACRENVAVTAGQTTPGIDFQMVRGSLIRGTVTLKDTGAPAGNVSVGAYGTARPKGGGSVEMVRTKADGTFAVRVPPGEQTVYVASGGPEGYVRPANYQTKVTTSEGKDATVNFALPAIKGKPVSGVVRLADGTPAARANVIAELGGSTEMMPTGSLTKADADGKFAFKALPPKSRLRAARGQMKTAEPVNVNGGETNVVLVIGKEAPITLKGRVVDKAGRGIPKAEVSLNVMHGSYGTGTPPVTADDQGNYQIDGMALAIGETVSIQASATHYGQSGAKVDMKKGVTVIEQPPLVLAKADSVVTGTVVDEAGQPLEGVEVYVHGRATPPQHVKTSATGAFEFADIVEGETLTVVLDQNGKYSDGGARSRRGRWERRS